MKCPKCNEEIEDNAKFCTKCGANILEEKSKKAEIERKKQKEIEDKKRLEEIRKEEERKREEAIKEAEKAEAIRKAREEGIEFEIIDKKPEEEHHNEFKVKQKPEKKVKEKKTKIKVKKNIFQRILNKIIFIIIFAAIVIGAIYYCYKQQILPKFMQEEIQDFDKKLQNVINTKEEINDLNAISPQFETKEWKVDPNIEADEIRDLTDEVSVIVKNNKEGLIDNQTGEIVLEPKYTLIFITEYYDLDKTEEDKVQGIVVKDIEKYYEIDKDFKIGTEVNVITQVEEGTYFYDHHDDQIYYSNELSETSKVTTTKEKELKICTDIDIITTEGIAAKDTDLPEKFVIDFSKSTVTTKGYFDTSTGKLTINCDYDEAYEFSDGYAAVKIDDKAGIIDENGNKVIELKYEETRSVHNGVAFAKQNGKWGILEV